MDEEPEIASTWRRIRRPYERDILKKLTEDLCTRIAAAELEVAELQGSWRREKAEKEPEAMRVLAANYLEARIATDEASSIVKAEQFKAMAAAFYKQHFEPALALTRSFHD